MHDSTFLLCPFIRRTLAAAGFAVFASLFGSGGAFAQDDSSPFKFLKPWIEERLFGNKPAGPAAPQPSPAPQAPAAEASAPEGATSTEAQAPAPSQTPAPAAATGTPAEPPPENATATTAMPQGSPPDDQSGMSLRGTTEEDAAALSTMAAEVKPEPLRFALLAGRSVTATMAAVGKVADDLSALLGRPVELLPFPSYDSMIDAQRERRIDGGFFSAAAFALADSHCACVEPLVAPRASDGSLAYFAVIAIRAGSGIATLADLGGKTVAVGRADSIGSRRVQLAGLIAEGFDPATAFGTVLEVDSPEIAVRMVAAGSADAAFAWSSLAGDLASGYSRGTFTDLVAAGALSMDQVAILWRSPAIGHAPFAVMRTLAEADKDKIRTYLVGLADSDPAAYDMLNPFYGGGYDAADAKDYGGLETLLAQNVDAVHLPLAPAETGATAAAGPGAAGDVESVPEAGSPPAPAPVR